MADEPMAMGPTSYDSMTADAYQSAREIARAGLSGWRVAVDRHLARRPEMTIVDIGAGTGAFSAAFADWFGARVVAVEPAGPMRARIPAHRSVHVLGGRAESVPMRDATADGAWLSTVLHHIADLAAAAHELRRVLRPGAPLLIRSAFPGRGDQITLVRLFPETERVLNTFPTIEQTAAMFGEAGFQAVALEQVPQQSAPSLPEFARRLSREADTLLRGITDAEYARGVARLSAEAARAAAGVGPRAPVIDRLTLLVLR